MARDCSMQGGGPSDGRDGGGTIAHHAPGDGSKKGGALKGNSTGTRAPCNPAGTPEKLPPESRQCPPTATRQRGRRDQGTRVASARRTPGGPERGPVVALGRAAKPSENHASQARSQYGVRQHGGAPVPGSERPATNGMDAQEEPKNHNAWESTQELKRGEPDRRSGLLSLVQLSSCLPSAGLLLGQTF